MKAEVQIREITLDDVDAIQQIGQEISEDAIDIDFKKVIGDKIRKGEESTCLVAESNGKVVGYMISNLLYAGFGLKRSAWIVTIGVKPEYMGKGIGKQLAEETFKVYRALGISHIYSSVMWDSIDLLSFFKTLGFDRSSFINLKKRL